MPAISRTKLAAPFCLGTLLSITCLAMAESNIDVASSGNKFGWTENGGWLNLQGDIEHGVHVGESVLGGFAWHESFGWINFGNGIPEGSQYSNSTPSDFGVNIAGDGTLSGYAWGENIGWIKFDTGMETGVAVDQVTGRFTGYAWGENVGWITFDTVDPSHVAKVAGYAGAWNWTRYF